MILFFPKEHKVYRHLRDKKNLLKELENLSLARRTDRQTDRKTTCALGNQLFGHVFKSFISIRFIHLNFIIMYKIKNKYVKLTELDLKWRQNLLFIAFLE